MTYRDGFPRLSARSARRGDAGSIVRRARRRSTGLESRRFGRLGAPPEGVENP